MLKSHACGELRGEHAGQEVTLAGWVHRRRDHGGLAFIDLRDSTGLVQVVIRSGDDPAADAVASELRSEFVVQIKGTVARRRAGTENAAMPTGEIEVQAAAVTILNTAKTPPFYINEETTVDETLRLKYRYLDLRRERMHNNLILRARATQFVRSFLSGRGFVEVETPVLANPTPEGARDYLVPSRVSPGNFYALPQSPQQFKQILMVAGIEKYFQIAHCFRDEDLRADRQPEHTQIDLEWSFIEREDILRLMEDLYTALVGAVRPDATMPSPFTRLTYQDSMERYGCDKPDLRYGLELADCSDIAAASEFSIFKTVVGSGGKVRGLAVPGGAEFTRKQIDELTALVQSLGAKGLVSMAFTGSGGLEDLGADDVRSPVGRFFTVDQLRAIAERLGAKRGDLALLVAGDADLVNRCLDGLRREIAERLSLADPNHFAFAFVLDFPLLEKNPETGGWEPVHHPFTSPRTEDIPLLDSYPGDALAQHYDLVCNGQELGSGSIRIHSRELQQKMLGLFQINEDQARERFGHMLDAFEYGAPPHGGFGHGLDRIVALLAGERDIREVIAFPKTKSASDLMTGAPLPADPAQLALLQIKVPGSP